MKGFVLAVLLVYLPHFSFCHIKRQVQREVKHSRNDKIQKSVEYLILLMHLQVRFLVNCFIESQSSVPDFFDFVVSQLIQST